MKRIFSKKEKFIIEYQVEENTFVFLMKCNVGECIIDKFNKIYEKSVKGVYPYPFCKILSIKKANSRIII
jgi:predicted transglutaminase-like protease